MREASALRVRCKAHIGALHIDVDFTAASAWTVLFGPSGSGKSSLLRLIAGLWTPKGARVEIGSETVSTTPVHLRRVGFVAQDPALFPHLNVIENVRFGCTNSRKDEAERMLELFQLQALRRARIQDLSGGESQRVALARALAGAPRFLLLDEVFTGMHLPQRDELLRRVHLHCSANKVSVLSVTHDPIEASLIAADVLKLDAGRVTTRGAAAEVLAVELASLRLRLTEGLSPAD